jgi:hypothetical protein
VGREKTVISSKKAGGKLKIGNKSGIPDQAHGKGDGIPDQKGMKKGWSGIPIGIPDWSRIPTGIPDQKGGNRVISVSSVILVCGCPCRRDKTGCSREITKESWNSNWFIIFHVDVVR